MIASIFPSQSGSMAPAKAEWVAQIPDVTEEPDGFAQHLPDEDKPVVKKLLKPS